jgi:hypothetical protein
MPSNKPTTSLCASTLLATREQKLGVGSGSFDTCTPSKYIQLQCTARNHRLGQQTEHPGVRHNHLPVVTGCTSPASTASTTVCAGKTCTANTPHKAADKPGHKAADKPGHSATLTEFCQQQDRDPYQQDCMAPAPSRHALSQAYANSTPCTHMQALQQAHNMQGEATCCA